MLENETEIENKIAQLREVLKDAGDIADELTKLGVGLFWYRDEKNLDYAPFVPRYVKGRVTKSKHF